MSDFLQLRDSLIKEQDKAHVEFSKTKKKKKLKELGMKIHNLGEQINTISHVKMELEKHGIENPTINKAGKCYHCDEPIDLDIESCVIYRSQRNSTISLFHKPHFNVPPVAGMVSPLAIIGQEVQLWREN